MAPLAGELTLFAVEKFKYPVFTSGDLSSTKCIAFIGGLTAGLGTIPYAAKLSAALKEKGWKLVQFHWSSAYDGYESHDLTTDARETTALARHLADAGMTDLIWMGNSTGCQDIAKYLSTRNDQNSNSIVKGGILQAPVSDRESVAHNDETNVMSAEEAATIMREAGKAESMIAEHGDEVAPQLRAEAGGKMTWKRLHSLYALGGDDDYFSSDLPTSPHDNTAGHAHPLSTSFGQFTVPTLALWSERDQFAWSGFDTARTRMRRWAEACPPDAPLSWAVIDGADHEVTDEEVQEGMIVVVFAWLEKIGVMKH